LVACGTGVTVRRTELERERDGEGVTENVLEFSLVFVSEAVRDSDAVRAAEEVTVADRVSASVRVTDMEDSVECERVDVADLVDDNDMDFVLLTETLPEVVTDLDRLSDGVTVTLMDGPGVSLTVAERDARKVRCVYDVEGEAEEETEGSGVIVRDP
jgi:hypothetical protein